MTAKEQTFSLPPTFVLFCLHFPLIDLLPKVAEDKLMEKKKVQRVKTFDKCGEKKNRFLNKKNGAGN